MIQPCARRSSWKQISARGFCPGCFSSEWSVAWTPTASRIAQPAAAATAASSPATHLRARVVFGL
ncbi:hypothetical protein ACMHYB_34320 [Sorangium sp. So ce1128]